MKGVVRHDEYLTNLALAYPTGNLIGSILCPIVGVENFSDYVFVDADDAIMQYTDDAEGVPSHGVDFAVGTPYSYRTIRRAMHAVIKDKEVRNATGVVRTEQRVTNKLTHRLRLKHEMRVQAILRSTSKVTNYTDVDATADARWDESTPDLEGSIITAVKSINDESGMAANVIVIPFQAALYAANMSFIKDTLKYQYGKEIVSAQFQNQVMQLVGLPPIIKGLKVVISNGRVANYNKGETASVGNPWGKDCLIGYVPPRPETEEGQFGLLTMEYDGFKVTKDRIKDPMGTKILTEWDYDILEANLGTWYLLQNVIG